MIAIGDSCTSHIYNRLEQIKLLPSAANKFRVCGAVCNGFARLCECLYSLISTHFDYISL